jgi:Zn-dependent protease
MLLTGNFNLEYFIAAAIVLFFGMGWHEYAHAVVADWWGDPTPRMMGRLTPNPIVHINWIGWLMFLFLGFGVLGSVPINHRAMRDPRWGNFWTSFAGPLSNLLQALFFALVWWIVFRFGDMRASNMALSFLATLCSAGVSLNILLFLFNMLPLVLPAAMMGGQGFIPMDGWQILYTLLPGSFLARKQVPNFIWQFAPPIGNFLVSPAYAWRDWMPVMAIITIILFVSSFVLPPQLDLISMLLSKPTVAITRLLLGL